MAIVVDPSILDYMARTTGCCTFVLEEAGDREVATRAMEAARRAVGSIAHPEEPDDPLPSWMSSVHTTSDGARFSVDMADAEAYEGLLEQVLEAVVDAVAAAGLDQGLLTCEAPEPEPEDGGPPEAGAGHLPLGVALPEPSQELFVSSSGDRAAAGYFVPQAPDELMGFFEATLPGLVVSFEVHQPEEPSYGLVVFNAGGALGIVTVRDLGEARSVEITVHTDSGQVEELMGLFRDRPLPEGAVVRVDRRR